MLKDTLTIKEKIKLLILKDNFTLNDIDNKVPIFRLSDGPHGLRNEVNGVAKPATYYCSENNLAMTFNKELAFKFGQAIGSDCIDQNVNLLLGPGINIKRNPLNGRNFEYLSEDPFLSGLLAKEYINGVQSMNVGCSLKHFCCNNSEFNRRSESSEISEDVLRDIYLKPFELALEAKPWSVMTS